MPLTNDDVARLLHELAKLTELDEGSPQAFRVRAYSNGANAVEGLTKDVRDLSASQLAQVKGIGKSIATKIVEYVDTGTIAKLEELRAANPPGVLELLRIPGLGPKTVSLLREVVGIESVEDLEKALDEGKLADLPGFGVKTSDNIRQAIKRLGAAGKDNRQPVATVMPIAESIVTELAGLPEVARIEYAGSLRRLRETIGDVDILVASDDPATVSAAFVGLPLVGEVIAHGDTKSSIVTRQGLQVDLRVVAPGEYGAALVYFTGSKAHNIELRERAQKRGWTLNEYALTEVESGDTVVETDDEAELYAALDLTWVPPEQREATGEVNAAADGELPARIELADVRGDLHDHTTYSGDGRNSLEEMVAAAAERGLSYLAITDHAEDLRINGVNRAGMLEQRARLKELQEAQDELVLLHGAELNIDAEGGLDYDREFLLGFDWCVASVHSHFNLDRAQQTARVVAAIEHPAVNVIGHLTGRKIGKRPGIELDLDAVFAAAIEHDTALEINSNLARLDCSAEVIRAGVEAGVTFVISTDSHTTGEFDNLRYGVRQARRGWLTPQRCANTWTTDDFLAWARASRS